jgi:hypothetical protein
MMAPDPDPDLDRDATAADLQPGNVLGLMIRAHRRNDYRSAMRHRKHLRRCGLSVTLTNPDAYTNPGELGFQLDQLVDAMARGDFRLATAHRKGLAKAGVNVVPVITKAERGPR